MPKISFQGAMEVVKIFSTEQSIEAPSSSSKGVDGNGNVGWGGGVWADTQFNFTNCFFFHGKINIVTERVKE